MVKRCPTCNRSFDDETLSFCLEDGTPLVGDSAGRADSQETLVSPSPTVISASPATQNYGQLPGKATVSASQADIPGFQSYLPPPPSRSKWPWVVAIVAIVLIVIGGIVVAAVFIPPLVKKSGNGNRPAPTPVRPAATPAPTWESTPGASPSADADVPDDEDEVLSQLTKLEEEWAEANVKGDKQALESILADEYVGGPTTHSKRAYIDSLKPDGEVQTWELSELTVKQDGPKASVQGTLTQETTKGTEVYDFTDKFVWRNSRWQAVASKSSRVK